MIGTGLVAAVVRLPGRRGLGVTACGARPRPCRSPPATTLSAVSAWTDSTSRSLKRNAQPTPTCSHLATVKPPTRRDSVNLRTRLVVGVSDWVRCGRSAPDASRMSLSSAGLSFDDSQPDLPSGGHAELPGGGQRDYLVTAVNGGAHGAAVIWSPNLGVLAVSTAGVLCAFYCVVDALSGQCLRRRSHTNPLVDDVFRTKWLLSGAIQLHVHAADVLVRRGIDREGSR
jgi:hypothetical protein